MTASEKRRELILLAYEELKDVTPARYDCGLLCGAICCHENDSHGDEDDCGMLLLPDEEKLLGNEKYTIKHTSEGTIAVCNGSCRRDFRPFACRIFPYYAQIKACGGKYSIKILPDPRAVGICPLLWGRRGANIYFLRAMKRAVRILLRDEEICRALCEQSELVDEITLLRKRLCPKTVNRVNIN